MALTKLNITVDSDLAEQITRAAEAANKTVSEWLADVAARKLAIPTRPPLRIQRRPYHREIQTNEEMAVMSDETAFWWE